MAKVELKLKKRHPNKQLRLGRHIITPKFQSFDLDESEMKELKGAGCTHWVTGKKEVKKTKTKTV